MKRTNRKLRKIWIGVLSPMLSLLIFITPGLAIDVGEKQEDALRFYLATDGSDSAGDGSLSAPMHSIQAVHDLLIDNQAYFAQYPKIEISILSGLYQNQTVEWRYYQPGQQIHIAGNSPRKYPVFSGAGCRLRKRLGPGIIEYRGCVFMYIVTPSDDQRNLHDHGITISQIVVENYRDGISIGPEPTRFNARKGNLAWNSAYINIHHVIFRSIGSKHLTNNIHNVDEGGYGAIVLNNALATKINDNQFLNIENREVAYNQIHAVYIANGSSYTEIRDNLVDTVSGDPFKIHNAANYNTIVGNDVFNSGAAMLQEYLCSPGMDPSDCARICPSVSNLVGDNQIQGTYNCIDPDAYGFTATTSQAFIFYHRGPPVSHQVFIDHHEEQVENGNCKPITSQRRRYFYRSYVTGDGERRGNTVLSGCH